MKGNIGSINTRMKIEELAKAQKDIVGWNFYQERQHVEGLFYSRFNFIIFKRVVSNSVLSNDTTLSLVF